MRDPELSVLLTVYHAIAPSQLRDALDSVHAQTVQPAEVIVVEDENGNIVRETMKDTDVLARYKTMHETLVYLSHLDHEDTESQMLEKLRREELIPLGSRIRTRLATEFASREELLACLEHLLGQAGNASLMTQGLRHTLCDHPAGNYRILTTMAAELLAAAA